MKKSLIWCLLLAIVSIMATGCSSCQSANTKQEVTGIQPVEDAEKTLAIAKCVLGEFHVVPAVGTGKLVTERVIAADREWMWLNVGDDYEWFETQIELEKSLVDSTQTGEIKQIKNVFQKVEPVGKGFNVTVWQVYTNKYGTVYKYDNTFWIEDLQLNETPVPLTFQQSYERLMQANIAKPDTRFCVLRKPVGPNPDQHPIYIYGNARTGTVAVDAITGHVSCYLGGPLGEWP